MKDILLVIGGVSLSTTIFVILLPIILGILLIKLIFKKIDLTENYTEV